MFYSAFGKILTLSLEAHVLNIAYHAGLCTTLSIVQSQPSGIFNALIFKGKPVRFQQRIKGLFANWPFFKVLLKVQCRKLFICMRSSQAFDLGVDKSLRFWEKKLIIRTRREIRVQISRSIAKSKMRISISKSGFPNRA